MNSGKNLYKNKDFNNNNNSNNYKYYKPIKQEKDKKLKFFNEDFVKKLRVFVNKLNKKEYNKYQMTLLNKKHTRESKQQIAEHRNSFVEHGSQPGSSSFRATEHLPTDFAAEISNNFNGTY